MDPIRNPYVPGAGTQPPELTGRENLLERARVTLARGALIMALHRVAQENLPLLMIAAGLPQVTGLSGRSKSYAERLFDFPPVDAWLTSREKDYLRCMAELGPGPHRSGDVAERLGISVMRAGPLRGGLIAKGMIYSPAHGDTAFTVPLFDAFMKRTLPEAPRRPSARPRKTE